MHPTRLSFDPWGKRRQDDWSPAEQTIASSTPTGFTGHEMDDETGLINMAARLYDPLLGRFLSADTMIPNPGNLQSFNRYSYVKNNPLRYVDPTGHEEDETNKAYRDDDDTTQAPSSDIDPDGSFSYTDSNGNEIASGDLDIDHETGRATGTISIGGEDVSLDISVDNDGDGTTISGTGVTGDGDQYSVSIGIDGNGNPTMSYSCTPDFGGEGNDGTANTMGANGNHGPQDSSDLANVETEREPTKASVASCSRVLNVTHNALAVAGLAPVVGIVPALIDAALYGIQGDVKNMMVAGFTAWPGIGQGVRGAQFGVKAARGVAAKSTQQLAKYSGMLRNAAKTKGNFGIGSAKAKEALNLGKAWVGKGYKVASDGKTLVSKDGLRQFRPPSYKPKLNRTQANFEWRSEGQTRWLGNGHLDIIP